MGTAASAQASEQVQGASPDEIQAYLDQMSPEDRAKLQGALAEPKAPAEGEAAAVVEEAVKATGEIVADAAAPAEAAGEAPAAAEAAAEASAAPAEGVAEAATPAEATKTFLREYFDKVQKRTADMVADQAKLVALASDPEAKKKLAEESKAWFEAEAKPLLVKAFRQHDVDGSDVLEKDEADAFFKLMVEAESDFDKAVSAFSIEAGVKMSMGMLDSLSEEEREKIKPFLDAEMKKMIEAAQAEVQKKEDKYKGNKAECDDAAFKVLDTSKDGRLQLAEYIAAFEPDSARNLELHLALGYVTKEEIEEQNKKQEQVKEQAKADGCAQQ